MTETDLLVFVSEQAARLHALSAAVLAHTFIAPMAAAVCAILACSSASMKAERWHSYRTKTRYRGSLMCTAKREKYWGHELWRGFFGLCTARAARTLCDPHVLQVVLDDDRVALLSVSPVRYYLTGIGDIMPARVARSVLRRAVFVGIRNPRYSIS